MPSIIARFREVGRLSKQRLRNMARPRAFQAYCLGTIRSGTTTMAKVFDRYRSEHEVDCDRLVPMTISAYRGQLDQQAARSHLKRRDREYWPEMESAHFLAYLSHDLVELFPSAKFILTIRDPMEWLKSAINHHHRHPLTAVRPIWVDFRATAFGRFAGEFSSEEFALKENGLYPIHAYLKYWFEHNSKVLATIPSSRLLIVRTRDISNSLPEMERFVGCAPESLSAKWSNIGAQDFGILGQVPREFVLREIERYCGSIAKKYFPRQPESKAFDDKGPIESQRQPGLGGHKQIRR